MNEETRSTPAREPDFYALLTEFEQLVLDANDPQLPRRAGLPVTKRLNEVRAKLQVFGMRSERGTPSTDICEAIDVDAKAAGPMKWCDRCSVYLGRAAPCWRHARKDVPSASEQRRELPFMARMALVGARDYLLWLVELNGIKRGAVESVRALIDKALAEDHVTDRSASK